MDTTQTIILLIYLVNSLAAFATAIWIYFDSKSRCLPSYRLHAVAVFVIGLIGLWLPYLLYYFLFRPPGKLVRCSEGRHWKLEYLEICPYCDPRALWSESKAEVYGDLWRAIEEIELMTENLPEASDEVKKLETDSWFRRLAHYQNAYIRYNLYNISLIFFLFFYVLVLNLLQMTTVYQAILLSMVLFVFLFLSLSFYRLARLIQGEIIRIKIILKSMVGERAEAFRFAERRGFAAHSAWALQVATGMLLSVAFLQIISNTLFYLKGDIRIFSTSLAIFSELLILGLFFAGYLALAGEVRNSVDVQQVRELRQFLSLLVKGEPSKKEEFQVEVKSARKGATKATRKTSSKKTPSRGRKKKP